MGLFRHIRTSRLVTLTGVLGAMALLLTWGVGMNMKAHAVIPTPGLNYSIEAVGESGCNTTAGDAVCYVQPGKEFTLNVTLDPLPSDIPSYEGFDAYLTYTGLTSADDADAQANWPDCGFPAVHFEAGLIAGGCSIGIEPGTPSTYTGLMLSNTFTCSASGAINLVAGDGKTDLLATVSDHDAEGEGTMETLNITCGEPPTATPPPIPTALPGTGTGGGASDSGSSTVLWLTIAVLMTAAIAGIGAFSWRSARSARLR